MDDRLPIEGADAQYSAPHKVFQTLGKCGRHTATKPGGIAIFHGTLEPVRLLGGMGRFHSPRRERTRNRGFAGVHLAVLSLSASVICGPGHSLLRVVSGQLFLSCRTAGSRQCKLSVVTTV